MKRLTVIAALLAFIAGTVVSIPAPLLHSWIASDEDDLKLYGVTGTLYQGRALAADFGRMRFDRPNWKMNPLGLLKGGLSHDVRTASSDGNLSATLELGLFGTTAIHDVSGAVPIDRLIRAARLPLPPMEGTLQLDLKQAEFSNGILEHIKGSVVSRGTTWSLLRPPLLLGNYRVDLSTEDEQIVAMIQDQKAELNIKGQASLSPTGAYEVDLRLRPGDNADRRIDNLLAPLGKPEAGGWYRIQRNGQVRAGGA